MAYRQSLDYLYSLQRFGIKLGLENTATLLERVGNPQAELRIVHVAGTNGKGSTAATLASILQAAGLSAGLYTSPHLHSFTERVRVAGVPIEEAEVARLAEEIRPHAEALGSTFFEVTTALALLHFQRTGSEWAILEVGMGGRLDATNVVTPELCLITPVGLDHAAHLGDSLAAVAAEKAGIIKPQVPVLSARQPAAAAAVIRERALVLEAPLFCAGDAFSWGDERESFAYRGLDLTLPGLRPGLVGGHQQENLSLALAAAEILRRQGVPLTTQALRQGVAEVRWPGRLEWLDGGVLLDGAHNPAGAQVLADYLAAQGLRPVHWVVGMKADKAATEILQPLLPHVGKLYATSPPVEEAVPPSQLLSQAAAVGVAGEAYADPQAALQAALAQRRAGETILVAGSLFLVAAVREQLLAPT